MPKFEFSKLVRDKIVEKQIASGAKTKFRQLSPAEHKQELIKKLIEETKEIDQASEDELASEIADVQQAIDDLTELVGLNKADIAQAQEAKNQKNGPFKLGHYIDYVELEETNEWVTYYRQNPERYPEIK